MVGSPFNLLRILQSLDDVPTIRIFCDFNEFVNGKEIIFDINTPAFAERQTSLLAASSQHVMPMKQFFCRYGCRKVWELLFECFYTFFFGTIVI